MFKAALFLSSLLAFSLVFFSNLATASEHESAEKLTNSHESAHAEEEQPRASTRLFPPKQANRELAARPAAPELLEPAFMTTLPAGSAVLKWKEVSGASHYHFQLATDPNFKWLVANESFVQGTSFEAKGLTAGQHYYWRVATQKDENEPGSTKSSFSKSMFMTK